MYTKNKRSLKLIVSVCSVLTAPSFAQLSPAQSERPDMLAARKVVADPNRVYTGLFNVGSVAANFIEMSFASAGNAPGVVCTFHNWNKSPLDQPVQLQTMLEPMEGESLSPLEMAEIVSAEGGVMAIVWDAIGYLAEEPEYWAGTLDPPVKFSEIFSGAYDDYIRSVAREIKEFGKPILLSPAAEFNSIGFVSFGPQGDQFIVNAAAEDLCGKYGDPAWPDGPERVRDLFRYVINIFNEERVTNVTWFMYSHTGYMNPAEWEDGDPELLGWLHPYFYYPGDDYIDWIGASAYVSNDDPTKGLEYQVGHAIDAYQAFTQKPFFIPEFGVTDAEGESRASRMRWLFEQEIPGMPEIRAWSFADADLWALYFGIPRLGSQPDEIPAWLESVWASGLYTNRIRLR